MKQKDRTQDPQQLTPEQTENSRFTGYQDKMNDQGPRYTEFHIV